MKKLTRNEIIAVGAGLALLTYLFFAGPLVNLFTTQASVSNNNNPMPETGYIVREVALGEGELAERGDTLTVHYVGTLPGGRVFDSSRDSNSPIRFTLGVGQVIRGWDEGLQGMRAGGKRILTIASDYAYGSQGIGAIPPNSTLIFEVELLDVEKLQ